MKKSTVRTAIRSIVREEVAVAIKEVITELREPVVEKQPQAKQPKKKKDVKEKQYFTSNSVLNDILNETANDDSEWKTVGGGTFDSNQMSNVLKGQYADMMNGGGSTTAIPQTTPDGRPINQNGVSDDLMDNLTKDYSKTLQAMEKAADRSRGV